MGVTNLGAFATNLARHNVFCSNEPHVLCKCTNI
jgi:hypothetical protein